MSILTPAVAVILSSGDPELTLALETIAAGFVLLLEERRPLETKIRVLKRNSASRC